MNINLRIQHVCFAVITSSFAHAIAPVEPDLDRVGRKLACSPSLLVSNLNTQKYEPKQHHRLHRGRPRCAACVYRPMQHTNPAPGLTTGCTLNYPWNDSKTLDVPCDECQSAALATALPLASVSIDGTTVVPFDKVPSYRCPGTPDGPVQLCVLGNTDATTGIRVAPPTRETCADCMASCVFLQSCDAMWWSGRRIPRTDTPSDACAYTWMLVCWVVRYTSQTGGSMMPTTPTTRTPPPTEPVPVPPTPTTAPVPTKSAPAPAPVPTATPTPNPAAAPQPPTCGCPLAQEPVCLSNNSTAPNSCLAACRSPDTPVKCNGACPCPGRATVLPDGSVAASSLPLNCVLPPQPGPCRSRLQRSFFNTSSGACEPLVYGGCGGNANNFETPESCFAVCKQPGMHGGTSLLSIDMLPLYQLPNIIASQSRRFCASVAAAQTMLPASTPRPRALRTTAMRHWGCLPAPMAMSRCSKSLWPTPLAGRDWHHHPLAMLHSAASCASSAMQRAHMCQCTSLQNLVPHRCNVWSFCSDVNGCGTGCREARDGGDDVALTVGPLSNCTDDGAFARGACMLAFADNPFNLTLSRDVNWTSGFVLPKGGVATVDGWAKVAVAGVVAG